MDVVRVVVGKAVPHPNTVEHHIEWIELYGVKKDGQVVDKELAMQVFTPPAAKEGQAYEARDN